MTARNGKPSNDLVNLLERQIKIILRDQNTPRAERLKAIEAGAKIAMIKHRIKDPESEGAFFASK